MEEQQQRGARRVSAMLPEHEKQLLLEPFESRVRTPRLAFLYQVGLGLVALTMLILPVIYIALIGLVVFGVYYHATENLALLSIGGSVQVIVLAYVTPLVAGVMAALFMVKPMFAPRMPPVRPRVLDREDELFLYRYVERLCRALGAPNPRRIDVDMQVNASASFRRGVWSFLRRDLVLTIGMPLVAGLSVREFTGVLAHEFGHFTQGAAMRLNYIIHSVNRWFARVVYERDAWDLKLEEAQRVRSGYVQAIVGISRLCVWLSRRILWVLMTLGHAVSSFMSRQMEYNADAHQAAITGSAVFRDTHMKVHILSGAMQQAIAHLSEMWQERRLADDVVALVLANHEELAGNREAVRQLEAAVFEQRTNVFDTHPAPKDRVARVNALRHGGIVESDQPASVLFADFQALCKSLTLEFYREQELESVAAENIVATDEALAARAELTAGAAVAEEFFFESELASLGVFPAALHSDMGPVSAQELVKCKEAMRAALREWRPTLAQFLAAAEERSKLSLGLSMAGAGLKFEAAEHRLPKGDQVELHRRWAAKRDASRALRERLAPVFQTATDRAATAFRFARDHESELDAKTCGTLERASALNATFEVLRNIWPRAPTLREKITEVNVLLQFAHSHGHKQEFERKVGELLGDIGRAIDYMSESASAINYPYDHADGIVSLARYLVPEPPAGDMAVVSAGAALLQGVVSLYLRMWSDVARVVLTVEKMAAPE